MRSCRRWPRPPSPRRCAERLAWRDDVPSGPSAEPTSVRNRADAPMPGDPSAYPDVRSCAAAPRHGSRECRTFPNRPDVVFRSEGGHADASRYCPGSCCRVPRHVRADRVRRRRGRADRAQRRGQRSVPVDQPRLGPGRDAGRLRGRGRVRRAPEPGGHAGAGRAPRVPLAARSARTSRRRSPARSRVGASCSSTYREALDRFDGGVRQVGGAHGTAGILATYPQPFLSVFPAGSSTRSSARRC